MNVLPTPGGYGSRILEARELLGVTCWCEHGEKVRHIPAETVRQGLTWSCGRPKCQPGEVAA